MERLSFGKMAIAGLLVLFGILVSARGALADGTETTETKTVCTTSYGGTTECHEEEVPREEIVHEVEDTGIVENVILAAGIFAVGYGMLAFVASQVRK